MPFNGVTFATTPPRWQAWSMWQHVATLREGSLPERTGPPLAGATSRG